jgi:RNA polymerase sigma-70 factor, ECF subfamily
MTDDDIRKENEIIERSKKDVQAFGEIYETYFDRIFNFIHRQTDDEETAGDLCSQTFVNALNSLPKYQFRGFPFSAWLYKIAGNEVNKYYRKNKGKKVFSLEELKVREMIEQSDETWDEELIQRLLDYMKELPTDMTESGAKMRTYRALDKLRQNFKLKVRYDG